MFLLCDRATVNPDCGIMKYTLFLLICKERRKNVFHTDDLLSVPQRPLIGADPFGGLCRPLHMRPR